MTKLRAASFSDIGKVRKENQDRLIVDESSGIYGVADGVGGLPFGAQAAQTTIEAVREGVGRVLPGENPDLGLIVVEANDRVAELGRKLSPALGIGTTLTFASVRGGRLILAHVGDSRCYAWRDGAMERLTEDHSVENEARLRRAKGEVVYYSESQRNALTRCVGQPAPLEVDVSERTLRDGDRYLFCSDGITRLVGDEEIAQALARVADPAAILRSLVELAVDRGGPDNASGVLLMIDEA